MEIKQLSYKELKRIYKEYMVKDFPPDELKPLKMIKLSYKRGIYESYGLYENEELCGYACFVKISGEESGYDYIFDFFAIREELRDKGYGTIFIKLLQENFAGAGSMLGEVENPAYAEDEEEKRIRQRRLDFYLRNQVVDTGVDVQLFGVEYRVLEVPLLHAHSPEEVKRIYSRIYRSQLPELLFEKKVMIR